MATVTHDGQSLLVDGRRIWLVSGTIDYFRIPRPQWSVRIRAAAEAGLNTALVRCPWSLHEPRRGEFNFEGIAEVAAFIQMLVDHGMRCILRPGPFIAHDLDLGGMPSWLLTEPGLRLREGNGPFLEATSRYLGRLLKVLAPFSGRAGGPIVIVQVEHEWHCGNQDAADAYLLEIARFIREHDFDLPLINTNNLWQRREETIDTWCGRDQMLRNLRQLRAIHPTSPLIVGEFWIGEATAWNESPAQPVAPPTLLHELAQVLAAGAQFNLAPFHGGTNFGFSASRLSGSLDRYSITSADGTAPLSESGVRTPSFHPLRRLCTCASQFGRVFASLSPTIPHATLAAEATAAKGRRTARPGFSVIHLTGAQGDVIFVFADESTRDETANVLLPNGQLLPVHFGSQPVAWCLLNAHVGGRAKLDWTNLNAFASNGRSVLILFGPAGTLGQFSINYGVVEVEVPKGQSPIVEVHEEITVVVVNEECVDRTYLRGDVVHVGIDGFNDAGEPIPAAGWKNRYEIMQGGDVHATPIPPQPRRSPRANLSGWEAATIDEHIQGTAPRYATIDGPSTQEQCSAGSGYGFVRLTFPEAVRKTKVLAPGLADRVHLYVKGQLKHLLGYGPGAEGHLFDLALPGSEPTLVAMIDNLGRYAGGNDMSEGKGLVSHFHEVQPKRIGKPTIVESTPRSPFILADFIEGLHGGALTSGRDYAWTFEHRTKSPAIIEIRGALTPALVLLNDQPIAFYSGYTGRPLAHLLVDEYRHLRRGRNDLHLAPLVPAEESDLAGAVEVYDSKSLLTQQATWAFAKWEQPRPMQFRPYSPRQIGNGRPVWYRATFTCPDIDRGLWFEPTGLTKGQIYLNGHNVGRYFVATAAGDHVPPQKRYYLPDAWLNTGGETNELLIFDEHGASPAKSRLVFADSAF